jgi:hypothetical protein
MPTPTPAEERDPKSTPAQPSAAEREQLETEARATYEVLLAAQGGRTVPVRILGEQHVREDLGRIPTAADWLREIKSAAVDEPLATSLPRHPRGAQDMSDTDTVTVRFIPQAWVNDCAIQVDPAGPTTFTVPAGDAQNVDGDWLADHSDASDRLQTHENAPRWIRKWSGPFEIEIEHQ